MSYHVPRVMPIKTVELDFTDDGYPDFHAQARTNIPLRLADDFRTGEEERVRAAMLVIFPEWDFVDEEGRPLPHTTEGIGALPQDLAAAMFTRWSDALRTAAAVPKASGDGSSPASPDEAAEPLEASSPSDMCE